jgi:hypothetical protein
MNFINRVKHIHSLKNDFIFVYLAFQFSTALSHYEAEQQALKTSLDANGQLLKQVMNN